MKRPVSWVALLAVVLGIAWQLAPPIAAVAPDAASSDAVAQPATQADPAREAFEQGARGRMMRVGGRVERILADDRDGSPHQRFIIRTVSGISLLVAHNLDLAPRLEGLAAGEQVVAYGEYEWNDRGGVLHWTHDDPAGRHEAGYIEWRGRRYQ